MLRMAPNKLGMRPTEWENQINGKTRQLVKTHAMAFLCENSDVMAQFHQLGARHKLQKARPFL